MGCNLPLNQVDGEIYFSDTFPRAFLLDVYAVFHRLLKYTVFRNRAADINCNTQYVLHYMSGANVTVVQGAECYISC